MADESQPQQPQASIPGAQQPQGSVPFNPDAAQQQQQQQIQMRVDERQMTTSYANAFRTNGTAEEVIIDFGMNMVVPTGQQSQPEIHFRVNDRVILNYYSAKRLALTLGNLIRQHEEQFGELELDPAKRRKNEL